MISGYPKSSKISALSKLLTATNPGIQSSYNPQNFVLKTESAFEIRLERGAKINQVRKNAC